MGKFLVTGIISLFCCPGLSGEQEPIARIRPANIPFTGNAMGGTLVLGYVQDPHHVHLTNVSINTSAGESAESVVNRLARAVIYSDAIFAKAGRNPNAESMVARMAQGSMLSIIGSNRNYLLAGTETGLGIPKPPHSLSCSYDRKVRTIDVKWINPPDDLGYDSICIRWCYRNMPPDTPLSGGGDVIVDRAAGYTIKIPAEVKELDLDVWLKGFRHQVPLDELRANNIPLLTNAIPSDVAAIHLTSNGYGQEETYGIPFFAGVAPNWVSWSTVSKIDKTAFEQGDKYAGVRRYEPVNALLAKPYYQIIKAPPQDAERGVYRKFLGLTPRHTYRLTVCLSTLEMDSIKGDWSFSLHAVPNGPDGKDLTGQQMAGLAPLPDGRSGPQAGRVAVRGPGNTTKGAFDLVFSADKSAGDPQSSHITLPAGVDTITVWVRFRCSDPKGKVGFSGVRLEDISAIENPKSPAEVREEEAAEEIRLLKWMEKAAREASGAEPRP